MYNDSTWTPQRTTALYVMVTEQKLSAGQIAAAMGLSRNSVISKIFRTPGLRLAGATKGGPSGPRVKREDGPRRVSLAVPRTSKPTHTAIEPLRVPFMRLRARDCRYPLDERDEETGLRMFCGRRTQPGIPWCPEHAALMFKCE